MFVIKKHAKTYNYRLTNEARIKKYYIKSNAMIKQLRKAIINL